MGSVLVLFAHPAFQRSRVNRAMVAAARKTKGVTVHDLYETYPDFLIEVREEQLLVEKHDTIVLQHPFFWYSSPALIKEWLDLVLEYRWAYGEGGDALRGKILAQAISAGGGEEAYQRSGANHFHIRELLAPYEQTARLCKMGYAEAFTAHNSHKLDDDALIHVSQDYSAWLGSLRDGTCPLWLPPP